MKALWERGEEVRLHGPVERIKRILSQLSSAETPEEMDQPGFYFHPLAGRRKGTYSVRVSANWRITFEWQDENAVRVDYEDYH